MFKVSDKRTLGRTRRNILFRLGRSKRCLQLLRQECRRTRSQRINRRLLWRRAEETDRVTSAERLRCDTGSMRGMNGPAATVSSDAVGSTITFTFSTVVFLTEASGSTPDFSANPAELRLGQQNVRLGQRKLERRWDEPAATVASDGVGSTTTCSDLVTTVCTFSSGSTSDFSARRRRGHARREDKRSSLRKGEDLSLTGSTYQLQRSPRRLSVVGRQERQMDRT